LSPLASRCLFFSQSHGGYLGVQVANHYDKVYFLNNREKHAENIRANVAKFGLKNVEWNFSGESGGNVDIIYSENYSDIDEEIIRDCKPFILANVSQKLIKNSPYAHVYELSGTNMVLCVPDIAYEEFLKLFHYYLKDGDGKLHYDNLIHLCIMVKNGGKQFEDTLNANKHLIDRWTILDTGSTDETVEIINRVLVGKKRGELHEEPFINFRDSRNRLLELAGEVCKFTLMLDDTYIINGDLRDFLNEIRGDQVADSFTLYIQSDDVEYGSNRILKTDRKLKYLYKVHEVVQERNNMNVVIPLSRVHILDGRFDYMEQRTMARKKLDLQLLYEEVAENPNNPRSYYYLAQTYNLLEEYEKAYFYFLKRADHPVQGFMQEKIDAVFEAARIANFKLNKPWNECLEMYHRAYKLDDSRPDSLYFLGIHYYLEGDTRPAFDYFKKAFEIGYPIHCQYSLKPTLSFHFLPKFLSQLAYQYNDFVLGEKCSRLFLEKNKPDADMYNVVVSWYNIFVKLNSMNYVPENVEVLYSRISNINKKPLLCFVADGGFEPWTGSDILVKGVGGSETYIIEMARYMQKHGVFKVIVFCNCTHHSIFEGVEYIPLFYYSHFTANVEIHTCIVSRFSEYIPVAIHGKVQNLYLVLHDLTPSGMVLPIHEKFKKIFCLSEWHVGYFLNIFPQFKDITVPFYYGIDVNKFNNEETALNNEPGPKTNIHMQIVESVQKIKNKFIYSSFPNRGLLQLLQMWPKIFNKYPDATLHIYADVNGKWVNSVAGDLIQQIKELLSTLNNCGINYRGWVNKSELADAWKTSEYWFYPCTFMETFCLTAVEAALSKTLAITNGLAALQNTVGDRGVCINGDASTPEWQEEALLELFSIMENKPKREELIMRNHDWASTLSWESQANKLLREHIVR
jgi:tetratricopeptide (TPR) repeat protein